MNDYISSIILFLHIVATLGFFVALGLERTGLRQIQGAVFPEQVRAWMSILQGVLKLGFVSMLATVITGFYMMVTDSGGAAWIFVSLGALVLVILLSVALTGPRMAVIGQALATEKASPPGTFHILVNHPLLWISIQARVAIALGIVFLMTAKPNLGGSLLTIGVAIVLGLASTLRVPRRARAQRASSD